MQLRSALRTTLRRVGGTLLLLAIAPGVLAAQGGVRGVVVDSLVTGGPVANALVTVDGLEVRTRTDEHGRFALEGLPAGNYVVRHHGLWLDSLSLPPLTARVRVRTGRTERVTLASPTVRAYQRAVCGTTFSSEEGIVRGELRDAHGAARPGVFVGAVWSEAILTAQGLAGRIRGSIDTTDASGMFSLCGVPRSTEFHVRAGSDTLGTGELTVALDGRPVTRRDLLIGTRDLTSRVVGRVTTATGAPIRSVVISVAGDTVVRARADEEGRFTLDGLPRRSTQLFVRSVGFMPQLVALDPGSEEIEVPDVVLEPVPQELDEVRVAAARTSAELEFLERRRSSTTGVFIDEQYLAQMPRISANTLSTYSAAVRTTGGARPGLRFRQPGNIQSGGGLCTPRYFVDGVDFGQPVDAVEEEALLRFAKRLELHPAPFMPARYTDFNGCGVVLIWTK